MRESKRVMSALLAAVVVASCVALRPAAVHAAHETSENRENHWETYDGKSFWYEDGVKQGTEADEKALVADGTVRGREICDPTVLDEKGNGTWFWLDAHPDYDGAKACNKEVYMPYIYQNEKDFDDEEIKRNAAESGNMAAQVEQAIRAARDGGTDTAAIGKWVRYDAEGRMVKGWYTVEGDDEKLYPEQVGNTYYYDFKTGLMAKGNVEIDGESYCFDETTGALVEGKAPEPLDEFSEEYYLEQARVLGIAGEELYDHLDGKMTYAEYLTMLKNAHDLQYGKNSNCYIDGWLYYETEGQNSDEGRTPIPLSRIIDIPAMADAAYFRGIEKDFKTDFWAAMDGFGEECDLVKLNEYLWDHQAMAYGLSVDGTVTENIQELITNCDELVWTSWPAITYMCSKYDRVTHGKLYTLPENHIFPQYDTMSVRDGIQFVYHYYRSLYPLPNYVDIAKAGTYNREIITDSLLNKETTLPEASNSHLPAEWHGTVCYYNDGTWGALFWQTDMILNERDFQVISEAGFNMVRIFTSWYHMQDPYMNTPNRNRLDEATKNNRRMVNLVELEYWDQIIAWAMKYDIHVQMCFQDTPGLDPDVFAAGWDEWFGTGYCSNEIFTNKDVQKESAEWFRMLSKRYAKIPNTYLSFNLINEPDPETDKAYAEGLRSSVEAIWEECPDRLIVCDVATHMPITGEEMAKMGCALSYHDYVPDKMVVIDTDYAAEHPDYYPSLTWPYVAEDGTVIDAEAAKDIVPYTVGSYNVVKKVAEKYGVGFMVNEFGFFYGAYWDGWNPNRDGNLPIPSMKVLTDMLRDKINAYAKDGVGWTSGTWLGMFADRYPWPIEGVEWYQPDNYPYFLNKQMQDFWKEVNGVAK